MRADSRGCRRDETLVATPGAHRDLGRRPRAADRSSSTCSASRSSDWIRELLPEDPRSPGLGGGGGVAPAEPLRRRSPRSPGWRSCAPPTRAWRSPSGSFWRLTPTSVAMNSFLPANIGTWVMLIMFTTVIAGATFAAMLSGIAVQKIPFSIFNIAVYLYLFLSVAGSFSIKLGGLADHWVARDRDRRRGVVFLAVLATRVFREAVAQAARAAGGRAGRSSARRAGRCSGSGPAGAGQLPGAAGDHRRLPGRVQHPGHLPQRRVGHGLELDLEQRLAHARRRRASPRP